MTGQNLNGITVIKLDKKNYFLLIHNNFQFVMNLFRVIMDIEILDYIIKDIVQN